MRRPTRPRRRLPAETAADPLTTALRQAGRGDQQAFADVYDLLAPTVHGVVLRVLRNPAQAEEVTQEVFVELWRIAPRFDADKGSPRSWAATIAHRRAVDRVRSEQSARDREERDAHHATVGSDTPGDEVLARLDRKRVRAALEHLTDAQREAIDLAYYGGHTYREVAVLLDVPEGTVKTRIRDGLIKLRDLMEVSP